MIGVYDSGLGGLMLLKHIRKSFPNETILYLGDRKNAPYGTKTREELTAIFNKNIDFFKRHNVKDLVIACNTLCSIIDFNEVEDIVLHDIISKTVKQVNLSKDATLLVLATPLSIEAGRYKYELEKLGYKNCIYKALPKLAGLIERFSSEDEIYAYLSEEFKTINHKIDGIVLGCTHYPIVNDIFLRFFNVPIYNSNELSFDLTDSNDGGKLLMCVDKSYELEDFINRYVQLDFEYFNYD